MSKKKEWKRKDARDAWFIIKYYKPNLLLNSVSITNKPKDRKKDKLGPVSNKLGEFGLFITFKRKNMAKGEKLPYFTNGWTMPISLIRSLEGFFFSLNLYDSMTKKITKFNPEMFNTPPGYTKKKKEKVYNRAITALLKEIHYISYWTYDKKGMEGRIHV